MSKIEKYSDFSKAPVGEVIEFDASVLSIVHEGKKEDKKPIVFNMKLESTGENFTAVSWNFDLLNQLKSMSHALTIANFEGLTSLYKEQVQIRVGKLKSILVGESKQKKMTSVDSIKENVIKFIKDNIKNPVCLALLDTLIIKNERFFKWPAARGIHHNYSGGLALHSLNVAKLALSHSEIYGNECFDKDILLTSALLHDIGKIDEYTEDCDISFNGNFTTHLVSGVIMVDRVSSGWQLDENAKKVITIVKHTIQSHHMSLEFGSPVTPKFIESVIVANCDYSDSKFEAITAAYKNINENEFTDHLRVIEGGRIYKWKKQL